MLSVIADQPGHVSVQVQGAQPFLTCCGLFDNNSFLLSFISLYLFSLLNIRKISQWMRFLCMHASTCVYMYAQIEHSSVLVITQ